MDTAKYAQIRRKDLAVEDVSSPFQKEKPFIKGLSAFREVFLPRNL